LPEGRGGISNLFLPPLTPPPQRRGVPLSLWRGVRGEAFPLFRYHPQPLLLGGGELEGSCYYKNRTKKTEKSWEFLKEFVKKCGKSSRKRLYFPRKS
jgi:hypothetical protein